MARRFVTFVLIALLILMGASFGVLVSFLNLHGRHSQQSVSLVPGTLHAPLDAGAALVKIRSALSFEGTVKAVQTELARNPERPDGAVLLHQFVVPQRRHVFVLRVDSIDSVLLSLADEATLPPLSLVVQSMSAPSGVGGGAATIAFRRTAYEPANQFLSALIARSLSGTSGSSDVAGGRVAGSPDWSDGRSLTLAEKRRAVEDAVRFAWTQYKEKAWGLDELRPVTGQGKLWSTSPLGLQLLDSLSTLYVMGMMDEFQLARDWVAGHLAFPQPATGHVSFFETNIRVMGGLLSAFALSQDPVFKDKAQELGDIMIQWIDPETGFPWPHIPLGPRTKSSGGGLGAHLPNRLCLAEIGTLQVEWLYLSFVTRDPKYGRAMMRIVDVLERQFERTAGWPHPGLLPNDVMVGHKPWKFNVHSSVSFGAAGDSYYEYLVKVYVQTGRRSSRLRRLFTESMEGARLHLVKQTATFWPDDGKVHETTYISDFVGGRVNHHMGHLACFSGGLFALAAHEGGRPAAGSHGDGPVLANITEKWAEIGVQLGHTCHQFYSWSPSNLSAETYGFLGAQSAPHVPSMVHANNILRPEAVESFFVLGQLTDRDNQAQWQDYAWHAFQAFERNSKAAHGYSGVRDVRRTPAQHDNLMQTFFVAETLKYIWLGLGGASDPAGHFHFSFESWLFNTEAHLFPVLDPDDEVIRQCMEGFD